MKKINKTCLIFAVLYILVIFLATIDRSVVDRKKQERFLQTFGVKPDETEEESVNTKNKVTEKLIETITISQKMHLDADLLLEDASAMPEETEDEKNKKARALKIYTDRKEEIELFDQKLYNLACIAEDNGFNRLAAMLGIKPHFPNSAFRNPNQIAVQWRKFVLE